MKGEQEPTIHPAHAHQYLQGPALPRSVRWRMQLGLLKYPESEIGWTTEDLHAYNEQVLKQQRAAYRDLCDHYELDLVEDENGFVKQADQQEEVLSEDEEDVDPLTMMVMDIEKKEKRRQELELKYRKEKALRKRGVAVDKVINDDSDGDRFDTYSVSPGYHCTSTSLASLFSSFCQKIRNKDHPQLHMRLLTRTLAHQTNNVKNNSRRLRWESLKRTSIDCNQTITQVTTHGKIINSQEPKYPSTTPNKNEHRC